MRKSFILLIISLCSAALAATDARPLDVVHFWDAAGPIVPLERANVIALPASPGVAATWEIKGARSAMRIKRGPALLFLVRVADGADPNKIQLFRWRGSSARKPYSAGESWRTAPLSITKAGDSFGLAPVGELTEGEYAFLRAGSNEAYCFGVDPAN
jgi:hypothetical protein